MCCLVSKHNHHIQPPGSALPREPDRYQMGPEKQAPAPICHTHPATLGLQQLRGSAGFSCLPQPSHLFPRCGGGVYPKGHLFCWVRGSSRLTAGVCGLRDLRCVCHSMPLAIYLEEGVTWVMSSLPSLLHSILFIGQGTAVLRESELIGLAGQLASLQGSVMRAGAGVRRDGCGLMLYCSSQAAAAGGSGSAGGSLRLSTVPRGGQYSKAPRPAKPAAKGSMGAERAEALGGAGAAEVWPRSGWFYGHLYQPRGLTAAGQSWGKVWVVELKCHPTAPRGSWPPWVQKPGWAGRP